MKIKCGLDVLVDSGFDLLRDRRLGLLAHAASVNGELVHALDLFLGAGLDLRLLMGPEHGLSGGSQDMQAVEHQLMQDIPVVSLYGDTLEDLSPREEQLAEIDVLVVDLQDVGSRYYTFAASMLYCMRVCALAGVAVIVLDRPNPLGGAILEGPLLGEGFHSFVGEFPVPVRHGLTIGEMARLASRQMDIELTVVEMKGWRREMWFDQTGLMWVMPSPNMPGLDTATVYPGACLVEATNVSEGRGSTRPFELIGAPWIDARRLCRIMTEHSDSCGAGVRFRPVTFRPTFQKHKGENCHGIQVHLTDRRLFWPFRFGLELLRALREIGADEFSWRTEPYEFVSDRPAIDLLCGTNEVRLALESGADCGDLWRHLQRQADAFRQARAEILMYEEEGA